MTHDREYFRQRAAEERALAFCKDGSEDAEVAGQLALAYSALARHGSGATKPAETLTEPA